jgi:membrane protein
VPLATHGAIVGLLTVSFALIYKVVPDTDIAWRDVWLGAVITALLFAVGRWVIGFYLRHSGVTSAFQAAGVLAVLLISMYYLVQIFLFGAVFTKVYASRFGSRHGVQAIQQTERTLSEEVEGSDMPLVVGGNRGQTTEHLHR